MGRSIALVLWFALAGNACGDESAPRQPKPSADRPTIAAAKKAETERFRVDAEKAKAGLLKVIRGEKSPFIGKPDPDKLKRMPVTRNESDEPGKFYWSAFELDVKDRRYSAVVGNDTVGCTWFYSGKFAVNKADEWIPDKPEVVEAFQLTPRKAAEKKPGPQSK